MPNHASLWAFARDLPVAYNPLTLDFCVWSTPAHCSQIDVPSWQTLCFSSLHHSFLNLLISFITRLNPLNLFMYMCFIARFSVTGVKAPGKQDSIFLGRSSQFLKIFVGWFLFDWLLTARPWCCWQRAFVCTHVQMRLGGKWPTGKKGRFLARREVPGSLCLVRLSEGWHSYFCLFVCDWKVYLYDTEEIGGTKDAWESRLGETELPSAQVKLVRGELGVLGVCACESMDVHLGVVTSSTWGLFLGVGFKLWKEA